MARGTQWLNCSMRGSMAISIVRKKTTRPTQVGAILRQHAEVARDALDKVARSRARAVVADATGRACDSMWRVKSAVPTWQCDRQWRRCSAIVTVGAEVRLASARRFNARHAL